MLLPGPEAQQLAVYIGWLLKGTSGGLAVGILFVIPGVVALLALSAIYRAADHLGHLCPVLPVHLPRRARYVECLRGNQKLSSALTGITAAVVGVVANLALYFALHTLSAKTTQVTWGLLDLELPGLATLRTTSLVIAVAAAVMIFRLPWSVLRTLGACAALGLAVELLPDLLP